MWFEIQTTCVSYRLLVLQQSFFGYIHGATLSIHRRKSVKSARGHAAIESVSSNVNLISWTLALQGTVTIALYFLGHISHILWVMYDRANNTCKAIKKHKEEISHNELCSHCLGLLHIINNKTVYVDSVIFERLSSDLANVVIE